MNWNIAPHGNNWLTVELHSRNLPVTPRLTEVAARLPSSCPTSVLSVSVRLEMSDEEEILPSRNSQPHGVLRLRGTKGRSFFNSLILWIDRHMRDDRQGDREVNIHTVYNVVDGKYLLGEASLTSQGQSVFSIVTLLFLLFLSNFYLSTPNFILKILLPIFPVLL